MQITFPRSIAAITETQSQLTAGTLGRLSRALASERQLEACRFFPVADKDAIADQNGMVPRLAGKHFLFGQFFELLRSRANQHEIAVFG
jgi:hypothetical protein